LAASHSVQSFKDLKKRDHKNSKKEDESFL